MQPPQRRSPFRTTPRRPRQAPRITRLTVALLLVLGILTADSVRAAGTDPLLALGSARLVAAPSGVRMLEVSGQLSLEDLLQFSFPAGLVIARGAHWVRYDLDGTIAHGSEPGLVGGITAAEVTALLPAGAPAASPAAILRITPARVSVALPADLAAGAATVLFYAVLEGETFISNAVGVALP